MGVCVTQFLEVLCERGYNRALSCRRDALPPLPRAVWSCGHVGQRYNYADNAVIGQVVGRWGCEKGYRVGHDSLRASYDITGRSVCFAH